MCGGTAQRKDERTPVGFGDDLETVERNTSRREA
jgi:hypothetical protein